MKRTELIREIEEIGCILIRHGGRHDWCQNPALGLPSQYPDTERLETAWPSIF
jgi:mRNA interferase HicA